MRCTPWSPRARSHRASTTWPSVPAYRCHLCSGTSMGSPIYSGGHLKSSIPASPICSRSKMPMLPEPSGFVPMFERESNLSVWPAGFYVSHAPEHSTTRRSSRDRQLALSIRCPNKETIRCRSRSTHSNPGSKSAGSYRCHNFTRSLRCDEQRSCPVRSSDNYYLEHRSRSLDLTLDS